VSGIIEPWPLIHQLLFSYNEFFNNMFSSCKNCTSLSIYFALHNKQSGEKTKLSPVSFIGTNLWFCINLRRIYTQGYVFDQWNDKCTTFQLIIFKDAFELLQITSTHTQTRNSSRTLSS